MMHAGGSSSGIPARPQGLMAATAAGAGILCVAVLGLVLLAGCGPRLERELPPELLGRWTTSHPVYADRSLELERERIGLGVGGGHEELHPLEGVERLDADQVAERFRLHYRDPDGTPELLDLELRFGAPNVLRLPHIDADWTRAHTAPGA